MCRLPCLVDAPLSELAEPCGTLIRPAHRRPASTQRSRFGQRTEICDPRLHRTPESRSATLPLAPLRRPDSRFRRLIWRGNLASDHEADLTVYRTPAQIFRSTMGAQEIVPGGEVKGLAALGIAQFDAGLRIHPAAGSTDYLTLNSTCTGWAAPPAVNEETGGLEYHAYLTPGAAATPCASRPAPLWLRWKIRNNQTCPSWLCIFPRRIR